jgi:hypothetical protein
MVAFLMLGRQGVDQEQIIGEVIRDAIDDVADS